MRIIVAVKQVPETKAVKIDEKSGTVIRKGVESVVNPLDLYAIEAALTLQKKYGGETIAVSMGPSQAEGALREALSMGIDRAVLVSDRAYAGSDTWSTSLILGEAIRELAPFDLIICGERATDGDTGQVGPELASRLGFPVLSYVNRIESVENGKCSVTRLVEDGEEDLITELPAVLTIVKECSNPGLPTLDGKIKARQAEISVLTQKELKIDASLIGLEGSPTRVMKIFRPTVARSCVMKKGGDEEKNRMSSSALADFLVERGFV